MDKAEAPIAVVTVTFSPGHHLRALLDSLPAAGGRGTRTVLADNGSTDGAPEAAAAADPTVRLLATGGNVGYGAAVNRAVESLRPAMAADEVDEEFFLLVNPDVVLRPGALDALVECARRHPDAGAVGPLIHDPDGTVYPSARALPRLLTGAGHAVLADVWPANPFSRAYRAGADMSRERVAGWLSGACLLVRTSAFDAVGGFDERYFMYLEDVDFGDRLARAGRSSVLCVDAHVVHAQGHSANAHPAVTSAAHHRSAYEYLADRHPGPWAFPLRLALAAGLRARLALARAAQSRRGRDGNGEAGAASESTVPPGR